MIEKLKAFWAKVESDAALLWERDKVFFIAFIGLIAVAKFRDVLIQLIMGSAKKLEDDTIKKDAVLLADENKANDQANTLVKDAEKKAEDSKNIPVNEDWYKKK